MEKIKGKNAIEKIIKLAYISAFLKDEKPLSLLIVAPPEQSKSHYILKFKTKYSHLTTDLSYMGLIKLLTENKNLKHIVIPDFLKVTEKNQSTKKNLISSLNAYLEEGIFEISLANREKIDLKGKSGGIITATTEQSFFQNAKNWNAIGFKSRFLPVSWRYSDETMQKVINKITAEESTKNTKSKPITYKQEKINIQPEIYEKLQQFAELSPRKLKNLKVLAKSLALYNNKKSVGIKEIKEIEQLNEYINLRFKEI